MVHLAVKDLTFTYPGAAAPALRGVSLDMRPGVFICICGESGCGKTTLLRHLKSALAPHGTTSGRVLVNGRPLSEVSERDQSALIGFVMQKPDEQIVTDKVWHELAFGLENLGIDQRTMRLRVAEIASYFGMQNWFHKDVRNLSGGQKQLLNLASVMAMHPSVLILDEPTSQLDPIAAGDFLRTVQRVNQEFGTTIIMTEHRLEEVFSAADEVVVMKRGTIIAQGAPREVAEALYAADDPMTYGLPTPTRVFYGVEGPADSLNAAFTEEECPITVREGRAWLMDYERARPSACTALPEKTLARFEDDGIALQMKEVWFRYHRDEPDVLCGLDLTVPAGSIFAIVGGNGTGKTTMLACACGALRPYRGKVRLFGKDVKDYKGASLYRDCVAMVPQDPQNLFVKNTVREELAEMLSDLRLTEEERHERVRQAAKTCSITEKLHAHPLDLSGGEQQRVALAKVLLTEPRLLLLDEPTKGIDSFFKRELAHIFAALKTKGTTIVLVSHDVEFCARIADSVSMLFDGDIAATSTPRSFFAGNRFYTTAANRMSRDVFANAITDEDIIELCLSE